jgi:hypothetical protein
MTSRRRSLSTFLLPLLVVLTACGAHVSVSSKPETLDGATIASRANAQLVKENPHLAPGTLTCADVKYKVGATSRCTRTVVLKDGRVVRIGATVGIDKLTDGGHFKIQVDDKATSFGVTGWAVLADLVKQYRAKYGGRAPQGKCPTYLPGKVGATMRCTLHTPRGTLHVLVKVARVDPGTFATEYLFKAVPR